MRNFVPILVSLFIVFASVTITSAQEGNSDYGQKRMSGNGGSGMGERAGVVKGSVADETTNQPVEYANVVLYSMRDSSMVTGGITDIKGNYTIDKVPFGRYYVIFKFIGYKETRVNNVMVTPKKIEQTLEVVKLKPISENIEEVVVTGQKSMLQSNLDKKVINVDRNINAEGGTALDIMRNIPSVEVDVQGNVSLRGSTNLTILVDGKPSQISSLEELPASIIQSVEVITNPSVRYDPDGMSGILNIVLVKKKTPGYHGMVSVNAGTNDKYSGTVNMNLRKDKLNFFGNFDYRHFYSTGSGFSNRITTGGVQNENQDDNRDGLSNNFRGGVDYFINPKNTLSLSGSINVRDFNGEENAITLFNDLQALDQNIDEKSAMNGKEVAMNYKRTFDKEGQEFTTDLLFSAYDRNSDQNIDRIEEILQRDRSNTDGKSHSFTFQSDFVKPIGNGGRLETGIKGIIRKQNSDYSYLNYIEASDEWRDTSNLSNTFVLDDQVYAGYAIYSNTIGPISYQGGVRVEDQIKRIDQQTQDKVVNTSLFNYFPSIHLKWDMNKTNALQVSYSKRVNRPSGRVLNPFVDKENVYNISYGNPYLKPEFTSSYEFGHSLNLNKTSINTTVFYRRTTDKITQITNIYSGPTADKDTLKSTYTNLASGSTLGVEVVASQAITRWLRTNGSFSFFKAKMDGYTYNTDIQSASESNSWTAKMNTSISLMKDLELQINGNYKSPVITGVSGGGDHGPGGNGGQGRTKEIYWVDLGLRYNVLKNKGTFTVRVSDIFNSRKFKSTTYGDSFSIYQEESHESRVVFIGFSYRINDYKQRRESKIDDSMSSDMDQ